MDNGVLFDIDGTLIDSTYHHALAWLRAFTEHEVEVPAWRLHRAVGMGGEKLITVVAGPPVESELGDQLRESHDKFFEAMRSEVRALPGAAGLLRKLHGDGFGVALATSGKTADAEQVIKLLGAGSCIDEVVTSEDVAKSKPSPDVISAARERLGALYTAMVGDSVYDVHAAAAASVPCVGLRTGGFGIAELRGAGAVLVADGLDELHTAPWHDIVHATAGEELRAGWA